MPPTMVDMPLEPAPSSTCGDLDAMPLSITGLVKRYRTGTVAVDGLDLSVGHGQIFGLLGLNGAGKTTTLRAILSLIRPTAGQVRIYGEIVHPGAPVLSAVGALVDSPSFIPNLTGRDNLELYWEELPGAAAGPYLGEAIARVGLEGVIDAKVKSYSSGMRQRLGLAQALMGNPHLLVLDEPTTGLDPQQVREMRSLIRSLAGSGTTVLLSSHLLGEVEQICTHAAVMDRGRLRASGTIEELTGSTSSLYLEVDDVDLASSVLEGCDKVIRVAREGGGLAVELDGIARSRLVSLLVGAGVGVESLAQRHRLEDVFLGLLSDAEPVATRSGPDQSAGGSAGNTAGPGAGDTAGAGNTAGPGAAGVHESAAPTGSPVPRRDALARVWRWLRGSGRLTRVEMQKQLLRTRTWLALAVIGALPVIITLAYRIGGPAQAGETGSQLSFFIVVSHSGLDMALAELSALGPFMLVIVVALFAGEAISSEATWGTLRYVLSRPVQRGQLLVAKLAVALALLVAATALISITGLASGLLAFGWHPVVTPQLLTMPAGSALVDLIFATAFTAWCMVTIASFSFMVSTMTDSVIGAVAAGIGFAVISEILDTISALGHLRAALPTHDLEAWIALFYRPPQPQYVVEGALVQLPYLAVTLGVAWWWFRRKDIVS